MQRAWQESGLDLIDASHLVGSAAQGVPFDPADAPNLARDLDTLCEKLRCPRPGQIVFGADFALRLHMESGGFLRAKRTTLVLGWPMLQMLDADELRAGMALALSGVLVAPGWLPASTLDARLIELLGGPLLRRTLTRLLAAHSVGVQDWWADWNLRARREPLPPAGAFDELRRSMGRRGRGDWQPALEIGLLDSAAAARLHAVGGADLSGGSHRSAASALLWEGLVGRMWTALEGPFQALLTPPWETCHQAWAPARERARALSDMRRQGHIELAGLIELAQCVEALAGGRAAYPLYREAYARERSPEVALALARSLLAIDPARARAALARIAQSPHAVAIEALALLQASPGAGADLPPLTTINHA
ncbi:MAG TPA: hypothetical protein VN259_00420 [Xanthomonadales bacterium]|nr:hypothetical protein [Xanthomonadales bacterium]